MLHAASRSALWPTASGIKIDVAKPSTTSSAMRGASLVVVGRNSKPRREPP
jgi:hypothetical protein